MRFRSPLPSLTYAVMASAALLFSAAFAQSPDLSVSSTYGFSDQLVTGEGHTVYLYTEDGENVSACTGVCTNNWKPVAVDGDPVLGEGVDPALLTVIDREDGTAQLSYAGHPLYTYVRDPEPGVANGQALGQVFYVLSAAGEPITGAQAQIAAEIDPALFDEYMSEGETVYISNCAACHGANGEGVIAPRLAGNGNLERTSFLVARIINGYPDHGMPAFRDILSDRQVAAVSTFVRNSWDNESGAVTEEEVAAGR